MNALLLAAVLAGPPQATTNHRIDDLERTVARLAEAVELLALQKVKGGPGQEINQLGSHASELAERGDLLHYIDPETKFPMWGRTFWKTSHGGRIQTLVWNKGRPVIQGAVYLSEGSGASAGASATRQMQRQGPEVFRGGQRGR